MTNGLLLYLTGGTEGTGPLRKLTDGAGTNTGIHESGRAKQLDGVADHGDTNNTFLSVYQSAFTWCGRVKMDDGNPTAIENFWGVADSDNGNVTVRVSTAGALQAGASDTVGLGYGEFAGFFSNGAQPWVDVVVALVQNGADIDVSAYKDGVFVSTQTISGKTLADITITTNSFIGADTAGGGTDFYAGGIADVRLYSKALSAAEALQFTDEPEHVIDPTTIEAWYKMDGYRTNPAVNDPIIDYSGKGRHGFWANGGTALTAQTEPLPQVILQSSNQRALFDGSSDSATVSASANIQDIFDGGGTIVAWLYPVSEGEPGRICDKKGSPISGGYSLNTRTGTPPTFGIRLTQEFSTTDW